MDKIRPVVDGEQLSSVKPTGDKTRNDDEEQINVGHHPHSSSTAVHGLRRLSGLLSSSSNTHSVPLTRLVPAAAYTNPYLSPELSLSSPALLFTSSSRQKASVHSIQHQVAAAMPPRTNKDIAAFFPGMDEFYYAPKKHSKSSGASMSTHSGSSKEVKDRNKSLDASTEDQDSALPVPSEPPEAKASGGKSAPLPINEISKDDITTNYTKTVIVPAPATGKTLASSPPTNLPTLSSPIASSSSPQSILPSASSPPSRKLALPSSPPRDYTLATMNIARGTPTSAQNRMTLKKRAASAGSSTGAAITGLEHELAVETMISRNQRQASVTDITGTSTSSLLTH